MDREFVAEIELISQIYSFVQFFSSLNVPFASFWQMLFLPCSQKEVIEKIYFFWQCSFVQCVCGPFSSILLGSKLIEILYLLFVLKQNCSAKSMVIVSINFWFIFTWYYFAIDLEKGSTKKFHLHSARKCLCLCVCEMQ